IHAKRLKKENIKEQLEIYSILKDMNINRKELVKELELMLAKETLEKTLKNLECNSISPLSNHGNVNKSERHTAKSMLTQLKQYVKNRVIEKDEVPKLDTIQNWIVRYANQYRQEVAKIMAQA
ncbi:13378_t:CDS:2, partial [Racocetra persica]